MAKLLLIIRKIPPSILALSLIGLLFVLVSLGGPDWRGDLMFRRVIIMDGEWWRLMTANLVHTGTSHLMLNLAGLLIIALVVGSGLSTTSVLVGFVVSALATTLGLWFIAPQINWYLGASGALHGLLALGALNLTDRRQMVGIGVLFLLGVKLIWEQLSGPMPGSESAVGVPVIVDAHLFGALGGVLYWGVTRWKNPSQS